MKTIVILLSMALLLGNSCKKKTSSENQPTTKITSSTQSFDTSLVGNYKLVWCDPAIEMNSSIILTLRYKSYQCYSSMDTTDKYILYWIPNNINTSSGWVKISNTAIYKNEDTNHSQPYIKTRLGVISDGFGSSSLVKLNGGNKFNYDTLILNYHVSPLGGTQYDLHAKYKKMP